MITINGFLHRDRLRDLVRRWMFDELQPGDVDELLQLIHFNNVFVSRYLDHLAGWLFSTLHGSQPRTERVTTKGALRDRVCHSLPRDCSRCAELAAAYARSPGRYFRETPFQGSLYFHAAPEGTLYAGSSRIKRIRRLAEKSARRLVDWLHESAGVPPQTTGEYQPDIEQRLLAELHAQRAATPERLAINDVAGIKVILGEHTAEHLVSLLQNSGCRLVERECHAGNYRATNLLIDYRPGPAEILAEPLHERMLRVFSAHGYTPASADAAFREFVTTGEQDVRVEIIVTSFEEMLESEIGRCMHEERIIRQRHNPRYYGQLAQNTGFLLEFLFTFPALPIRRLERLPLRLGDRYLPDYFDEVRRKLFGNPSVELNEL